MGVAVHEGGGLRWVGDRLPETEGLTSMTLH